MIETAIPLPGDQGGEAIRKALEADASVLAFRVRRATRPVASI